MRVIAMRIRLQGFIFTDFLPRMGEFYRDMGRWIASGQVKSRDTVVEGLERCPTPSSACSRAPTPARCWSSSSG